MKWKVVDFVGHPQAYFVRSYVPHDDDYDEHDWCVLKTENNVFYASPTNVLISVGPKYDIGPFPTLKAAKAACMVLIAAGPPELAEGDT